MEIDGNNMTQIVGALDNLPPASSDKPTVIIGNTVKGKGVSFMEYDLGWHAGALSKADMEKALTSLDNNYATLRRS